MRRFHEVLFCTFVWWQDTKDPEVISAASSPAGSVANDVSGELPLTQHQNTNSVEVSSWPVLLARTVATSMSASRTGAELLPNRCWTVAEPAPNCCRTGAELLPNRLRIVADEVPNRCGCEMSRETQWKNGLIVKCSFQSQKVRKEPDKYFSMPAHVWQKMSKRCRVHIGEQKSLSSGLELSKRLASETYSEEQSLKATIGTCFFIYTQPLEAWCLQEQTELVLSTCVFLFVSLIAPRSQITTTQKQTCRPTVRPTVGCRSGGRRLADESVDSRLTGLLKYTGSRNLRKWIRSRNIQWYLTRRAATENVQKFLEYSLSILQWFSHSTMNFFAQGARTSQVKTVRSAALPEVTFLDKFKMGARPRNRPFHGFRPPFCWVGKEIKERLPSPIQILLKSARGAESTVRFRRFLQFSVSKRYRSLETIEVSVLSNRLVNISSIRWKSEPLWTKPAHLDSHV